MSIPTTGERALGQAGYHSCHEILQQNMFRTIEGAAAEVTGYKRTQFRQVVAMGESVPDAEDMFFPDDHTPTFVLAEIPPQRQSL